MAKQGRTWLLAPGEKVSGHSAAQVKIRASWAPAEVAFEVGTLVTLPVSKIHWSKYCPWTESPIMMLLTPLWLER